MIYTKMIMMFKIQQTHSWLQTPTIVHACVVVN